VFADDAEHVLIDQSRGHPRVVWTWIEVHFDVNAARKTLDPLQQLVIGRQLPRLLGFRRDWHQVGEPDHPARRLECRFEHGCFAHVPAGRREGPDWSNPEAAAAMPVQQRCED
jgi:hypothetical protein